MSVSKSWINDPKNREAVLRLYRSAEIHPTMAIAKMLNTTYHNIQWVVSHCLSPAEFKALKVLRYSVSKTGSKNPMFQKTCEKHHLWKGVRSDGHGYLVLQKEDRLYFVHHLVVMEALGLPAIPEGYEVHHIDGDKQNNSVDNLALVTRAGHQRIHYMQTKDSRDLMLRKLKIAEGAKYLISQ